MCGRYVITQKLKVIEKRFNLKTTGDIGYTPNYNVGPGKLAPVITNKYPKELQMFTFGLTPNWAKKKMYLINARTEGQSNRENNPNYTGGKGIISMPSFRKAIRSQRCLVIADAFYEGPEKEKLSKPYLIYLRNKQRPFAFAGIWDVWKNEDGEEFNSFAIITTVANQLLQKIGHKRSPVILKPNQEQRWLNSNLPLTDVTAMLYPYDTNLMNAYPVSPEVKNPKSDKKELLAPIGPRLEPEYDINVETKMELHGMGSTKIKKIERDFDKGKPFEPPGEN